MIYLAFSLAFGDPSLRSSHFNIFLSIASISSLVFYLGRLFRSLIASIVLVFGYLAFCIFASLSELVYLILLPLLPSLLYAFNSMRFIFQKRLAFFLLSASSLVPIAFTDSYLISNFQIYRKIQEGSVHQDYLFHVAIASMLKNYGVASTGLSGLVDISYHTFSHSLYAAISVLTSRPLIEVYSISTLLMIPLLVGAIVHVASFVYLRFNPIASVLEWQLNAWFLTSVSLAGSPVFLGKFAFWSSYISSESYLISMIIFIPALIFFYSKKPKLIHLFLMFLVVVATASSKISVGAIFLVLCCSFLLGSRNLYLSHKLFYSSLLVGLFYFGLLSNSIHKDSSSSIQFFHFISQFGTPDVLKSAWNSLYSPARFASGYIFSIISCLLFFAVHFSPTLSVWVIYCFRRNSAVFCSLYRPGVLLTLQATIVPILVVIFMNIPGGAVYYFSIVPFFVALPLVLIPWFTGLIMSRCDIRSVMTFSSFAQYALLVYLVVCAALITASYADMKVESKKIDPESSALLSSLFEIQRSRNKYFVYSPSADVLHLNPVARCSATPFLYPALSERPWINVIDLSCPGNSYYGYSDYIAQSGGLVFSEPQFSSQGHNFELIYNWTP